MRSVALLVGLWVVPFALLALWMLLLFKTPVGPWTLAVAKRWERHRDSIEVVAALWIAALLVWSAAAGLPSVWRILPDAFGGSWIHWATLVAGGLAGVLLFRIMEGRKSDRKAEEVASSRVFQMLAAGEIDEEAFLAWHRELREHRRLPPMPSRTKPRL